MSALWVVFRLTEIQQLFMSIACVPVTTCNCSWLQVPSSFHSCCPLTSPPHLSMQGYKLSFPICSKYFKRTSIFLFCFIWRPHPAMLSPYSQFLPRGVNLGRLRGSHGELGMESRLTACKASAEPTVPSFQFHKHCFSEWICKRPTESLLILETVSAVNHGAFKINKLLATLLLILLYTHEQNNLSTHISVCSKLGDCF